MRQRDKKSKRKGSRRCGDKNLKAINSKEKEKKRQGNVEAELGLSNEIEEARK